MGLKILLKDDFSDWIDILDKTYRLVGPKPNNRQYTFDRFHHAGEIDLDYPTSALPPKAELLPTRENILQFDLEEDRMEAVHPSTATVLMGVHTCDLYAIHLLDEVFLKGYCDQHYLVRRGNTTIVTVECLEPCSEYAFCKDMGTYSVPEVFDLHLTDLGNAYAVEIGSEKGAALLEGCEAFKNAEELEYIHLNQVMSKKWASFPYKLEVDISDLRALMKVSQKSTLWEELSERCLGCGSCTMVCPTCYCFNVSDEIDLHLVNGTRYRVWDSCQLNMFAEVAGGHDFRAGGAKRQRHRFMRKYRYQAVSEGLSGCVGCGRCGSACLVNITPIQVLNMLYRRQPALSTKEAVRR